MNKEDYEYLAEIDEYERKRKEQEFGMALLESALSGSYVNVNDNPIIENSYEYLGEGISVFSIILFISFIFKKIYLKFFRNSVR